MLYFLHVALTNGPHYEDVCRSRSECAVRLRRLRTTFNGQPVAIFVRLSVRRPMPLPA